MECSETQENGNKIEFFFVRVSAKTIFPSQPDMLLLQNHPSQAFLVSKTYTFIHNEKETYIFAHMLRHRGEGGIRVFAVISAKNVNVFFGTDPLREQTILIEFTERFCETKCSLNCCRIT